MSTDSTLGYLNRDSKRQQLPEEVAAYVREQIMSGAVREGDFLRMERIAEAMGVSNTPVREGLLTLSNQGFVRQIPRRGFVVAPLTRQDIRDLFWVQATLAGELAGRAAKNISAESLDRLDQIMKAHDIARAKDDKRALDDLGHAFHREINLAAGSRRLAMVLGSVVRLLPLDFYAKILGWVDAAHDQHPEIVQALRKGNATKARKLMEHHLSTGADQIIETLEARGFWSESPKAAS
jgi:DNA-binding GntR family transcriptional regulator